MQAKLTFLLMHDHTLNLAGRCYLHGDKLVSVCCPALKDEKGTCTKSVSRYHLRALRSPGPSRLVDEALSKS